jgi:hypothetical protein
MDGTPVELTYKGLNQLTWLATHVGHFESIFKIAERNDYTLPEHDKIKNLVELYDIIIGCICMEFTNQLFGEDEVNRGTYSKFECRGITDYGVDFDDDDKPIVNTDIWNFEKIKQTYNPLFKKYLKDLKMKILRNRTTGEITVKYLDLEPQDIAP